jgi:two-component system, cell cycle response regulator
MPDPSTCSQQPDRIEGVIERRAEVRRPCDLETYCRSAVQEQELTWLARVRDVSTNGLGLVLGREFTPGTFLIVQLPDPAVQPARTCRVQVVHSTQDPEGGWLVGCTFAGDLSPQEQEALREPASDTWHTGVRVPASQSQEAYLVNIYPTGPAMGRRFSLGAEPVILGRDANCPICIENHSVSRRHARIEHRADGYYAVDLRSTNGTFINNRLMTEARLLDGDYLRVGNCIFRFLSSSNVEAQYHQEIYRLAIIDALTQIHNRRALLEYLERELTRSARHQRPLALVFFDIDHFKLINDRFGHLAGDFALRELADRIQGDLRKDGLFARYSGEEFAVVLVETTADAAATVAERIRALVADQSFEYEGNRFDLTVSLGVVSTTGEPGLTPEEFLRRADARLYAAKKHGRNRVEA